MNEESEIVFVTVSLSAFQEALSIFMNRRFVHYLCI